MNYGSKGLRFRGRTHGTPESAKALSVKMAGISSPDRSESLSPSKCRSTPIPCAHCAAFRRCSAAASCSSAYASAARGGDDAASARAKRVDSMVQERIVSVRPCRKRRVEQASYVAGTRPACSRQKAACIASWQKASGATPGGERSWKGRGVGGAME
jgi:hypothetical protein